MEDKFEILMNGGEIIQSVSDELTYDTLYKSEENLWSVLLMTGYITKSDPFAEGEYISLKIPNREIASIFQDTVAVYFKNTMDVCVLESLMKRCGRVMRLGQQNIYRNFYGEQSVIMIIMRIITMHSLQELLLE